MANSIKIFKDSKIKKDDNLPILQSDNLFIDFADISVATRLASSRSEAKRLIAAGSVRVDGVRVSDLKEDMKRIKDQSIINVGRRKFVKIRFPARDGK